MNLEHRGVRGDEEEKEKEVQSEEEEMDDGVPCCARSHAAASAFRPPSVLH